MKIATALRVINERINILQKYLDKTQESKDDKEHKNRNLAHYANVMMVELLECLENYSKSPDEQTLEKIKELTGNTIVPLIDRNKQTVDSYNQMMYSLHEKAEEIKAKGELSGAERKELSDINTAIIDYNSARQDVKSYLYEYETALDELREFIINAESEQFDQLLTESISKKETETTETAEINETTETEEIEQEETDEETPIKDGTMEEEDIESDGQERDVGNQDGNQEVWIVMSKTKADGLRVESFTEPITYEQVYELCKEQGDEIKDIRIFTLESGDALDAFKTIVSSFVLEIYNENVNWESTILPYSVIGNRIMVDKCFVETNDGNEYEITPDDLISGGEPEDDGGTDDDEKNDDYEKYPI